MTNDYQKLPVRWSQYLATQPETGMDFQVVNITLNDGTVIQDVSIINASIIGEIRGFDHIPFAPEDIVAVELTHRKWQFKR